MGCHDSKNRIQVCKNTVGKKILTDFAESKQYKYNRTVMRKRGHMRKTEAMINEIEKVIIGKREVIEQVLMTILAKGHVLLEDIPGVGKTTLALSFAKVMGVDYHRYAGCYPFRCGRILPVRQAEGRVSVQTGGSHVQPASGR